MAHHSKNIHIINLPSQHDDRGTFKKLFDCTHFDDFQVRQTNHVRSKKGILRGLHYQTDKYGESKIFNVLSGQIQLVAFSLVDQLGKSFLMNSANQALLVPKGYATGYLVLEDSTEVLYFSDNDYEPEAECGICWNDPILNSIIWENNNPILSEKDKSWKNFS